jgi:hypothetical protein
MRLVSATRASLLLTLTCAALAAPAGQVIAWPGHKPAPVAPPPLPPPMPDVGLGSRLVAEAAAYQDYMRRAMVIAPTFADADGVARSLRIGAAYQPEQFLRGEMAYAAIAALQDATFVAAVRAHGDTPEARYQVIRRIYADPANVFAFQGAEGAAGMAREALAGDGMRLFNAGQAVKQAAYDIQRQPWSLQEVADRDGRLESIKALATAPMPATLDETGSLQRAVTGEAPLGLAPDPASPPYSPVIVRAVALAALAAIGQAGDDQADNLTWLVEDYYTAHCLAEAKLALHECLAVAKPNYEDIFCLGQHAMHDTGACVVKGAGSTVPLEVSTQPVTIPRAHGAARHGRRRS